MRGMNFVLSAGLGAFFGFSAASADIITNGGFETGDFTGWTVTTEGSSNAFVSGGVNPHIGTYGAGAYAYVGTVTYAQTFTQPFRAGAASSFTVWTDSSWTIQIETNRGPITAGGGSGWHQIDLLSFLQRRDIVSGVQLSYTYNNPSFGHPGYWDEIAVTLRRTQGGGGGPEPIAAGDGGAIGDQAGNPVPEPTTLMGLMVVGMMGMRRR